MNPKNQIVTKKTLSSSLFSQQLEILSSTKTLKFPPIPIEMTKMISKTLEKSNSFVQGPRQLLQLVLTIQQLYLILRYLTFRTKAETTQPFKLLNHTPTMSMSTSKLKVKQISNQCLLVQVVVQEILPQLLASVNSKNLLFSRLQPQQEESKFNLIPYQVNLKLNIAMKS